MSERWPGGIVRAIPVTPTGPAAYGSAPGVWTLDQAAYWQKQGLWPNANIVPDPYFNYVSLLLSSTSLGNANNNLFVDSSGAFNPVGRLGNTTQGSFTPYSANWSNYFDGSGDYLSIPSSSSLNFGTGNWTIECWVYVSTRTTNYPLLFGNNRGAWTTDALALTLSNADSASYNDKFVFAWNNGGFSSPSAGTNQLLVANVTNNKGTWYHFAAVRNGTSVKMYRDGVEVASATVSAAATFSWGFNGSLIGGGNWDGASSYMDGYVSNLRVTSSAVYTAAFTPPTSPLTAISGTVYLTCQSNRFRDASTNNFTITSFGNTSVQDFNPFLSSTYTGITYNQSDITNWSGYFPGNGSNYLAGPSNAAFAMGTGDFTIEFWAYFTNSADDNGPIFDTRTSANNGVLIRQGNGAGGIANRVDCNCAGTTASSGTITFNAWTHVAVVRASSSLKIYLNGVGGTAVTASGNASASNSYIGAFFDGLSVNFDGYLNNLRVVKGTAVYTANFTPPTSNLTAISGTSLLTLQNAAFTDNSTNNFVITPFGNVTVTGNSPFNTTGFWSNYFDGSGDYLQTPSNSAFALGTGDYTVECWIYATSNPSDVGIYEGRSGGAASDGFTLTAFSSSVIRIFSGGVLVASSGTSYVNQWTHVAVTRASGTTTLWINGVSQGTSSTSYNCTNTDAVVGGGRYSGGSSVNTSFPGYISNFRIVKGTAVYTGAFTPPTSPLTAITNTSLLTCQNGSFRDNSTNNFTLTVAGNTSVQSFDPFYTATIASNGGSMYFDGNADYVSIPNGPSMVLSGGTYTLEAWVYPTGDRSAYRTIFVKRAGDPTPCAWQVSLATSTGNLIFYNGTLYNSGVAVPLNAWSHVAAVYDGTNINLYLNGSRVLQSATSNVDCNANAQIGYFFSSIQEPFIGYIANARILKGVQAYTGTSYTVPTAPANPTAATVLMVNGMNAGAYDATTINDMETVGNAQVSTVQSKFGGSSASFNSNADRLQIPITPQMYLGNTYTVEAWIYPTTLNGYRPIFNETEVFAGGFAFLALYTYPDGSINADYRPARSGTVYNITGPVLSTNTWYHVALSVNNSSARLFVNGVQYGSTTTFGEYPISLTQFAAIGGWANGWNDSGIPAQSWIGYIDDVRITKGIARYTSNFTPPTQAFPVY